VAEESSGEAGGPREGRYRWGVVVGATPKKKKKKNTKSTRGVKKKTKNM